MQSFHQRYPHGGRYFAIRLSYRRCALEYVVREYLQELIVCNSGSCRQNDATTKYVAHRGGSQSIFYEDPCQNRRCACDATFVSSKISGILEIVAIGFIPALCTEIPRAEIILQRFISATPVRAHKAAHINEHMQQIHIPMEQKKGYQMSKYAMLHVKLRPRHRAEQST